MKRCYSICRPCAPRAVRKYDPCGAESVNSAQKYARISVLCSAMLIHQFDRFVRIEKNDCAFPDHRPHCRGVLRDLVLSGIECDFHIPACTPRAELRKRIFPLRLMECAEKDPFCIQKRARMYDQALVYIPVHEDCPIGRLLIHNNDGEIRPCAGLFLHKRAIDTFRAQTPHDPLPCFIVADFRMEPADNTQTRKSDRDICRASATVFMTIRNANFSSELKTDLALRHDILRCLNDRAIACR